MKLLMLFCTTETKRWRGGEIDGGGGEQTPEECTKLAFSSVDYADEKCLYEAH